MRLIILTDVIQIIRGSQNVQIAKEELMSEFGLSEAQAQAIVDMRLRALTGLEREKLETEYSGTDCRRSRNYKAILAVTRKSSSASSRQKSVPLPTSMAMTEEHRSDLTNTILSMEDLIPDEDVVIAMNQSRIHQAHDTG